MSEGPPTGDDYCPIHHGGNDHGTMIEPLAIVGMALRLPGGINCPDDLWRFLLEKRDARGPIPASRYHGDAFYDPLGKPGSATVNAGYFLDRDLELFDATAIPMPVAEIETLDPSQRQLLEIVRECLENAGETGWSEKNIGCFVGTFGEDWQDLKRKDTQDFGTYRMTGSSDFAASNRISYFYDLRGPSVTIRTACSASLIALHAACQALHQGDCSAAIVAAANLILSPTNTSGLAEVGALSPDASCKTFDAKANGYARAEGVNALYIKRLSDAVACKDHIRAVIRSTASNSDGRSSSFSNPNPDAHKALMRSAYQKVGLLPEQTGFVELHGTGTAVGDPVEAGAVAEVFGRTGTYIGSVKPNVGHSEGASGITSVIKAVLALENRTIPPNIKFDTPSPKIPFRSANLIVPTNPIPWPNDKKERVSVNSFGLGGSNAHVILESARSMGIRDGVATTPKDVHVPRLLVLSADHQDSLEHVFHNCSNYLQRNPMKASDLLFTLNNRRKHLPLRTFAIADGTQLLPASKPTKAYTTPQTIFVFTGQGAQYVGMARSLAMYSRQFENDLQELDKSLSKLSRGPSWSIRDTIMNPPKDLDLGGVISQPLCTAIQIALVNQLSTWGVQPSVIVGHSSGEIAAAYASGAVSMSDAIRISYHRGQSLPSSSRGGGMAAVGLGRPEVEPYLQPGVTIGCENSPLNVTLSGDLQTLQSVVADIKSIRPETFVRMLNVDMAYHSYHMQEISHLYSTALDGMQLYSPKIPYYSTAYGRWLTATDVLDVSYWKANLERPVLFDTAIQGILRDTVRQSVFLEIGPHSALQAPLRQCFQQAASTLQPLYQPTLVRDKDAYHCLLMALGTLHCAGVKIDLSALSPIGKTLTDLPPYPFHYSRMWKESWVSRSWRFRTTNHHELLGVPILENNNVEPTWRNVLRPSQVPWVCDHQIGPNVVFPAAGYIAMAGEAFCQSTGAKGYSVRHVSILTAMILHENQATEIMTSLRPQRWTETQLSGGYEFTISSLNHDTWLVHCRGRVQSADNLSTSCKEFVQFPRKIRSQHWYDALRRVGLNYGPAFACLENISCSVSRASASAVASVNAPPAGSSYPVHPTLIDEAFQLLSVADIQGHPRAVSGTYIPIYVEELCIQPSNCPLSYTVDVDPCERIRGSATAWCNGKVVLKGHGIQMSQLEEHQDDPNAEVQSGAQLEWLPLLRFLDLDALLRLNGNAVHTRKSLEKLTYTAITKNADTLRQKRGVKPHLEQYRLYLLSLLETEETSLPICSDNDRRLGIHCKTRQESVQHTREDNDTDVGGDQNEGLTAAIERICQSLPDIIDGRAKTSELIVDTDVLSQHSISTQPFDYTLFIRHFVHENPRSNILEIGTPTCAATGTILGDLYSQSKERMFASYTLTNSSEEFLSFAKAKFRQQPAMEFMLLDITQDPAEQGFELGFYDLIIAHDLTQATKSDQGGLMNTRRLIQPHGFLLLQESSARSYSLPFLLGGNETWWKAEPDCNVSESQSCPESWDDALQHAGFNSASVVKFDQAHPYETQALMISQPRLSDTTAQEKVTLLIPSTKSFIVEEAISTFSKSGIRVNVCRLDEQPPANPVIISLLDTEGPTLHNITEELFQQLTTFISSLGLHQRLLWLTNSSSPEYSLIQGLARNVRFELGLDFATLEFDSIKTSYLALLPAFVQGYRKESGESDVLDYDYAVIDGIVNVGRFHWYSINSVLSKPSTSATAARLVIGKKGLLNSLDWTPKVDCEPGQDMIVVDVATVGMNFKDVLVAMGVISGSTLGIEAAGTVFRTGHGVTDIQPGNRVAIAYNGCFATRITVPRSNCILIPDTLCFDEAATLYGVYCTSLLSLMHIAKISASSSVLIHSACGGIGLSAIQLCRSVGAEIYATVGNDTKRRYLQDTFGLPDDHIFNSRDKSFVSDLMLRSNDRGVDVVLNSLSGELLHASWECVADFGIMVELGRRDIQERGKLEMANFSRNRGYHAVDYAQILDEKPAMNQRLMQEVSDLLQQGKISPVTPLKVFEAGDVEGCFRFFQKGEHIGKVAVHMPHSPASLILTFSLRHETKFDPNVAYLLVGGLGGLGRAISVWMAERGARHLIFLSRSKYTELSSIQVDLLDELSAIGCTHQVFHGSIASLADGRYVIGNAARPIRGVMQLAAHLKDCNISRMTYDDWRVGIDPKVSGTLNLQSALVNTPLDFFVLFSSHVGLHGWYGQANYAAGNAFQDCFVQYRHSRGLAASVLNIGAVDDIGMTNERPQLARRMRSTFRHFLPERELFNALELAILRSRPEPPGHGKRSISPSQIISGLRPTVAVGEANSNLPWAKDARFLISRNIEADLCCLIGESSSPDASSSRSILSSFLVSCMRDPSILNGGASPAPSAILSQALLSRICAFLMISEDEQQKLNANLNDLSLQELGVDSLVAIELRNWWRQRLGVEVTVLQILDCVTVGKLGDLALDGLKARFSILSRSS